MTLLWLTSPPRATLEQYAFEDGGAVRFTFDSDDFHDDAYATNQAGSGASVTGHGSSRLALESGNEFSLAPYTEVTFTAYGTVTEHASPGTDASALLSMVVRNDDVHGGQAENRRTLSFVKGLIWLMRIDYKRATAPPLPANFGKHWYL